MIARLFITNSLDFLNEELEKTGLSKNHPDLLYFEKKSKLGIEQARQIKEHFSLKPYQAKGRGVILEDAAALTIEAQNSLLKTLEELPEAAVFLMTAESDSKFLPTVLSRCEIVRVKESESQRVNKKQKEIELLLQSNLEERFEYIEKLKEKDEFLKALLVFFHQKLPANKDFVKQLLKAEEYANQNVNIRAILEYLMLEMPKN